MYTDVLNLTDSIFRRFLLQPPTHQTEENELQLIELYRQKIILFS